MAKKSLALIIVSVLLLSVFAGGCIEDENHPENRDPHIWMSPLNAKVMIENFIDGLDDLDIDEDLTIAVTIPSQMEWVENVCGEDVNIIVMVPEGADPHIYEPTTSQMRDISEADVYFKIGSSFEFEERWLETLIEQNPDMLVVDGSEGVEFLEYGDDHEDDRDDQDHENSITLTSTNRFRENADKYLQELQELSHRIEDSLEPYHGRKFLIYHPSMEYYAHEYGLEQIAVEREGLEPGSKGIESVIEQAEEEDIRVVFVSPQFDESRAETIADEIDGEVIELDPLAENYIKNLEDITEELVESFGG
ncbi:MAG: metal ABC transporter solute-binding protein, Zn/Mn family [Candidatus Saliniplasma sp.]